MQCYSGGCPGADMYWETEGSKHGIHTIAYSFKGHVHEGSHPYVMTPDELMEGWMHVQVADKALHRNLKNLKSNYVRNLLSRNWYQVKHSETIFAVGLFDGKHVSGGTGWAVQMGIDEYKPIYFFDQPTDAWYNYDYEDRKFITYYTIPLLPDHFAGIGTRQLKENGKTAIRSILEMIRAKNV